jgi:hypothetical protein
MSARFSRTLAGVAAGVATCGLLLGVGVSPAFAKSDSTLSGPRTVATGHAFRLTVAVGDDGGAKPASARLQVRDGHGHFHWFGGWRRLHRTDHFDESLSFPLTERHRGAQTFRAVITGYATTNAITVTVR